MNKIDSIKQSTRLFATLLLFQLFSSCGGSETPIDANTRSTIDSLSTAEIRLLRVEMDSQCQLMRVSDMPQLVDSIKKLRLREIDQQLRTIPK